MKDFVELPQELPLSSQPVPIERNKESNQEAYDNKPDLRPHVHEKLRNIGNGLEKLAEKYNREELDGEVLHQEIARLLDECVFYSEYAHALDILVNLEKKCPRIFTEFNYIEEDVKPFIEVMKRPLLEFHKTKSTKNLGSRGRLTEREEEEYMHSLGLKEEEIKGEKILDVGAGTGNFAKWAKENSVAEVVAVESSWGKTKTPHVSPEIKDIGVAASWKGLPFKNESFDRVVSVFAFPLWTRNWEEVETGLREMIRIVKKGGHINLAPAAPILEEKDTSRRVRKNWNEDYYDTIHRLEFEELLTKFKEEVDFDIGEPRSDLYNGPKRTYFPLFLKKR